MTELCDGFVALPGGIGTLDELFEAWTWNALGYHAKPFCLLNVHGFWDGLAGFMDHVRDSGFLSQARRAPTAESRNPGTRRSTYWTKRRKTRHKASPGNASRGGAAFSDESISAGVGRRCRHHPHCRCFFVQPQGDQFPGRRGCLRTAGVHRLPRPEDQWRPGDDPGHVGRRRRACSAMPPRAPNSCSGRPQATRWRNTFAIAALPVIIFFASLVAILYHLGIMQRIVRWVGGAIGWVTGVSRVESLGAAANIFVGQSESPLVVRPYLSALPPSPPVHPDDRRHGRCRGHDPRRLCRAARRAILALSSSPRPSCRRRAAS